MTAASAFKPLPLCVPTVSEIRGAGNDTSADSLCDALRGAGDRLRECAIVRDDNYALRAPMSRWITDAGVDGIPATGGGNRISPRSSTHAPRPATLPM